MSKCIVCTELELVLQLFSWGRHEVFLRLRMQSLSLVPGSGV